MNPRQTITESISQEVHRSRRRLRLATGSLLFVQGEKAESVFVVGSGCVRLVVHTDDASELFLFRAAEGEIFAEDHLLLESYQYSAIVETPTVVWSISRELFTQNVFEDQSLFRQYIQCLNSTRQQAFSNIRRLGIRSSPDRVLDLLSSLADDSVSPLNLKGRLKSLAAEAYITHETMYRAMRELEARGDIHRENGKVKVLRPTRHD